jgi:hypothetical protein
MSLLTHATAEAITINNPGFDYQTVATYTEAPITDWTSNYTNGEILGNSYTTGNPPIIAANSPNNVVDVTANFEMSQTTSYQIASGDNYQLTFYAGIRSDYTEGTQPYVTASLIAATSGDVIATENFPATSADLPSAR